VAHFALLPLMLLVVMYLRLKSGTAGEWIFKIAFIWAAIFLAIVNLKLGKKFIVCRRNCKGNRN